MKPSQGVTLFTAGKGLAGGGCEHLKIQTFTRFYYENQRETGGL